MKQLSGKKRFQIIDALRGFALAGIVIVHMVENYLGAPASETAMAATHQGIADNVVDGFIYLFLRGKFFALFSFLFGLSFYIQMNNADKRGSSLNGRFLWRLLLLFLIGYLHHLFYRGDILTIYALLGIFLIPFHRMRNSIVMAVAALSFLGLGRYIIFSINQGEPLIFEMPLTPDNPAVEAYFRLLKEGSFWEVLSSNATEGQLMKSEFQFGIFSRAYLTFGFFLLGMLAGRLRLFQDFTEHKKIIRYGILGATGLFILSLVVAIMLFATLGPEVNFDNWTSMAALTAFDLNNLAMTLILLGLFVVFYRRIKPRKILDSFAPYGRMALTNYVVQSIIGSFFFYGWGLGYLGELRNVTTFGLAILVVLLQMILSKWWLKTYYYGPLEWVWRSLTYLKIYPMKRTSYVLADGDK
jgi:uncharacterized protein